MTLIRDTSAPSPKMPRVLFVGRLARYQYLDMHQVVAQALTLSATLISQARTDTRQEA